MNETARWKKQLEEDRIVFGFIGAIKGAACQYREEEREDFKDILLESIVKSVAKLERGLAEHEKKWKERDGRITADKQ